MRPRFKEPDHILIYQETSGCPVSWSWAIFSKGEEEEMFDRNALWSFDDLAGAKQDAEHFRNLYWPKMQIKVESQN